MKDWTIDEQRLFQAKQVLLASIRGFVESLVDLDEDEAHEQIDELATRLRDGATD